jgi:hypothetical protein
MTRRYLWSLILTLLCDSTHAAAKPPIYLWFEPEWFAGVKGHFAYWTGEAKPTGAWGIAGPGISPEWTQGGESEWNSMGAAAEETKAECHRDFTVPRGGQYKLWVRYVDHRHKTEPFTVTVEQGGKAVLTGELGVQPVVPPNDEYQLYWGFSFGWGSLEGKLQEGLARLSLVIDKPGQAWRQLDAVLLTDDLNFTPHGREKPPFAYLSGFRLTPKNGASWRGSAKDLAIGQNWKRMALAGRDFAMWTGIDSEPKWWQSQAVDKLSLQEVLFQFSPPHDIRDQFHKQFAGRKDLPVLSWPKLVPGLYLGSTPDLSPEVPLRQWLERTKTPFYIMTNYSNPHYTEKTGPATYQALTGPLADQFLGYIHGEALGTPGVAMPPEMQGKDRRAYVDAAGQHLLRTQADAWSKIYKTAVPPAHWSMGIPCLSAESIALAHLFHEMGSRTVGYEEDATNVHVPMRIAFERGAARQYGGAWINYASGNFGDACNYFSQNPVVPRGAPGWFHSKYAITDGVTASWYRKHYYLNYLGGASAIYWEQSLANQWILPGPGKHPIQLSPFGRATEEFQSFVDRLPDRGEPYTPIAFLLSYGHGYERVNNECKMLGIFQEDKADLELRELFNVAWYPAGIVEGMPAAPDVQSMPSGIYGNIFDVLVDRPAKAKAILDYPVVWAAGDVQLSGDWPNELEDYVRRGGTLVVNAEAARGKIPEKLLGFSLTGTFETHEGWIPDGGELEASTPYQVERGKLAGARPLAWAAPDVPLITRHQVGEGAVILTLVPRMMGIDERAHPSLPFLMNGLTERLLPIVVRAADGQPLSGQVMYQINRTKGGWLVALVNNRGVDKTQSGVARVDRRAHADVVLRTSLPVKAAKELTQPRDLQAVKSGDQDAIALRVHPGDVQVVVITTK